MSNYPIGQLIAEMRRRMRLSQEELAGEICSVSTVSKIENGLQQPSRKVCESLLQRLGLPLASCNVYLGGLELERSLLEQQIRFALLHRRCEEVERLMPQYARLREELPEHCLEQQFYLAVSGWLLRMRGGSLHSAGEYYRKALSKTIPQFDMEHPEMLGFLTWEELFILQELAQVSYTLGNVNRGMRLGFFVKDYLEQAHLEEGTRRQWYPQILSTLAKWMENGGFYERELEYCECGIAGCVRWGMLREYPVLLAEKGYALLALGRVGEAAVSLKQACVIFQSIGDPVRAGLVKNKAKRLFQHHPVILGMQTPETGAAPSGEETAQPASETRIAQPGEKR